MKKKREYEGEEVEKRGKRGNFRYRVWRKTIIFLGIYTPDLMDNNLQNLLST